MRESSSRGSTENKRSRAVREGLVVGEVALACVLLVGGGLLLRSFVSVLDVDLGFRPEGAVLWELNSNRDFQSDAARTAFYENLIAGVEAIPGVEQTGLTDTPPLGRNRSWDVRAEGIFYEDGEAPAAFPRLVDSRYLEVMGIPLVAGRTFTADDDEDSTPVVILNEDAAETLFPGQDPTGRTILVSGEPWQVVGVVGDVRHQSLEEGSGPEMYFPIAQNDNYSTLSLVVRSRLAVESLARSVGAVLREADPSMPIDDYRPLETVVERAVSPRRFILVILGAFAGTALLLAALGIYAVLSYSVSQQIREIGIRMALGESATRVQRKVVTRTLVLAGAGVLIGAVASFFAARLIQSLLYGVTSTDALTFMGTASILLTVAALAGYLPARRASHTDPMVALRST